MRKTISGYVAVLLFAGLIISSCSKPSIVGSDLLTDEKDELGYIDSVGINFTATTEDSIVTFAPNSQLTRYLCGNLNDPILGKSSSEMYFQYRYRTNVTELMSSFVDSVVLRITYDSAGVLSKFDEEVTIEVFEVTEDMVFDETYYIDQIFEVAQMPVGRATFIPNVADSVSIIKGGQDTLLVPPVMSIRLDEDPQFETRFTSVVDSAVYTTLDGFRGEFKGFCVRMTSGDNTMLAFSLSSIYTSLEIYYKEDSQPDTEQESVEFIVDPTVDVKTVHFTHDYSMAPAGAFIGDPELCDSLSFIQGMAGLNTRFEIADLSVFDDVVINHAELILHAAVLPEDDTLFSKRPLGQLITKVENENGRLINSRDFALSLGTLGSVTGLGGAFQEIEEGNITSGKYVINTTAQIQAIARGDAENAIFLTAFNKQRNPRRVIIFGPEHSQYPAQLRLRVTKAER